MTDTIIILIGLAYGSWQSAISTADITVRLYSSCHQ